MSGPEYYGNPYRQETSGQALAALILAIAGFIAVPLICSVLAIVFANRARDEIHASRGRLGGAGLAQAGLILGWVGLTLSVIGLMAISVLLGWALSSGDDFAFYMR